MTKAIEAIIRSAQTASEIDFISEIDNIDDYFPKDNEINFYRIVQESVNNIIKHSRAATAKVEIKRVENALDLNIEDNGLGFGPDDDLSSPKFKIQSPKSVGFGLIGIKERADLLGGKLEIRSGSGQGTTIKFSIKSESTN